LGNWVTNVFSALFHDLINPRQPLPEAANLSVPDQIRAQGLNFTHHNVTTIDGYILDLWHVWKDDVEPAINEETGERKVAFMQHGLIDVAGTWWFNTP